MQTGSTPYSLFPRRFFRACVCAALAVLAAFGAAMAMGSAPAQQPGRQGPPPVPVLGDTAKKADFPVFFQGLGTVTAMNTVTVNSRVDGELIKIHFTEGQEVKEGDLLAEIDPRPYKAELVQAEGQLLGDQAQLLNARQELARYKVLLPQDSATPQQVEAKEALVRQYEAAVKIDQGRIDAARLQLSYCRITAPISGRLGLRLVDQGNMVRASDSGGLVVITQVRPISVLFTVTESQLPRVLQGMRGGAPLKVEAWDRTRSSLLSTGTLLTLDNRIDTGTGTIRLRAVFDNADYALFPNQFVNARILVDVIKDAVVIPTAAVQHATRGAFVYVVENGLAVLRDITVTDGNDTVTVVGKGLAPGDVVVFDGIDRLRDKSPVIVTLPDGGTVGGDPAVANGADPSGNGQGRSGNSQGRNNNGQGGGRGTRTGSAP